MKQSFVKIVCIGLLAVFCTAGTTRGAQDDEKDTPALLIKSAKFLEERPLDKEAKKMRSWAITWIIETDKVSVSICSLILKVGDKYKYGPEMTGQYTIGMAAFKLANKDKAADEDAIQLAGIVSAMTSYEAIVKEKPKARDEFMDSLLAKRADGSLAKFVLENNCKEKK